MCSGSSIDLIYLALSLFRSQGFEQLGRGQHGDIFEEDTWATHLHELVNVFRPRLLLRNTLPFIPGIPESSE